MGYGGELQVPIMMLILKEVTIVGTLVGSYGDLSELVALVAAGHVALHTVRYDPTRRPGRSTISTTAACTPARCSYDGVQTGCKMRTPKCAP